MSSQAQLLQTTGVNDFFSYHEVHVDSRHRDSGTNSHPIFNLSPALHSVIGFKVLSAQIPHTHWSLPHPATFLIGNVGYTLEPGTYDVTSLAARIAAISPGTSISFDYKLYAWHIRPNSQGRNFTIPNDSESNPGGPVLADMLGLDLGVTYWEDNQDKIVAPHSAHLTGPNFFYLASNALGPRVAASIRTNGGRTSNPAVIAKIPINVNPGGVIFYHDPSPIYAFDTSFDTFQSIDFYLVDPATLRETSLRNAKWSVTLQVLTQRSASLAREIQPAYAENSYMAGSKRLRSQ